MNTLLSEGAADTLLPEETADVPLPEGAADTLLPEGAVDAPLPEVADTLLSEGAADTPLPGVVDTLLPEETEEARSVEPQSPLPSALSSRVVLRHLRNLGFRIRQLFRQKRVTVSLDRDIIRVVVFRGREVLAWGTTQAKELVTGEEDSDLQEEGQANRLRTLLRHLGVRRGRVVTDLPLHTPLMRHLQLPKMRRRYVERVVISEVLAGIPQIKPTFLEIAPSGIPSNIIPHSKGVKCGLIRSNSPFSYSNHRPAKPKIPKPLVYAQVSPLGTSFATP